MFRPFSAIVRKVFNKEKQKVMAYYFAYFNLIIALVITINAFWLLHIYIKLAEKGRNMQQV
jgi:hypothetical protein